RCLVHLPSSCEFWESSHAYTLRPRLRSSPSLHFAWLQRRRNLSPSSSAAPTLSANRGVPSSELLNPVPFRIRFATRTLPARRHGKRRHVPCQPRLAMKTSILLTIVVVACAVLPACKNFELIRSRAQGPSSETDHCVACTDLGQAWALYRMGDYAQA